MVLWKVVTLRYLDPAGAVGAGVQREGGRLGVVLWEVVMLRVFWTLQVLSGLECSEKADIWSLGVVLWEVVTGERPHMRQLRALRCAAAGLLCGREGVIELWLRMKQSIPVLRQECHVTSFFGRMPIMEAQMVLLIAIHLYPVAPLMLGRKGSVCEKPVSTMLLLRTKIVSQKTMLSQGARGVPGGGGARDQRLSPGGPLRAPHRAGCLQRHLPLAHRPPPGVSLPGAKGAAGASALERTSSGAASASAAASAQYTTGDRCGLGWKPHALSVHAALLRPGLVGGMGMTAVSPGDVLCRQVWLLMLPIAVRPSCCSTAANKCSD